MRSRTVAAVMTDMAAAKAPKLKYLAILFNLDGLYGFHGCITFLLG